MARITAILKIHRHTVGKDGPYTVKLPVEEWPVEEWQVWGIAPGTPDEPWVAGREPAIEKVTVYYPLDGPVVNAKDRVTIDKFGAARWEVSGGTATWDENPTVAVTTRQGRVVVLERRRG